MAQIATALPLLLALYFLYRYSVDRAFLLVYVPCLMLVPLYLKYYVNGIDVNSLSLISLLFAGLGIAREFHRWKFTLTDLAALLFSFSAYYADAHYRKWTLGLYAGVSTFMQVACSYFIGKTLIELPGLRVRFAKRFIICLALLAVVSVWEFRMSANIFQVVADRLNSNPAGWGRQERWGFTRVSGPYGSSITAGMVFTCGLILQVWLFSRKLWGPLKSGLFRSGRRNAIMVTGVLVLGVGMTQSRGPWIGCGLGMIVVFVGFAKDLRKGVIAAGLLVSIVLPVTYVILDQYTKGNYHEAKDIDQQNAGYRRELLNTYLPVVEKGGLWGWGRPLVLSNTGMGAFVESQPSIDNQYLLMAVGQGYFGFCVFLFILGSAIVHLVKVGSRVRNRDDLMFVLALLGAIVATCFTLTTVFLGEPMVQILFLLCGWAVSVKPTGVVEQTVESREAPMFRRVFV